MKTMKKLSVIALVLLVGFGMVACGPVEEDPEYAHFFGTYVAQGSGDYVETMVLEDKLMTLSDTGTDGGDNLTFEIDEWSEYDKSPATLRRVGWKLEGTITECGGSRGYNVTAGSKNYTGPATIYLYFDDYDEPYEMSRSNFSPTGNSTTQSEIGSNTRIYKKQQ